MKKFKDAFNGLKLGFKDKAIKTQMVLGILAIIGGFVIKLEFCEWLAFVICIGLVISLEFVNSCLENVCDLYSTKYNEKIKVIKDMASGAVLVASFAALAVCLICVLRRII